MISFLKSYLQKWDRFWWIIHTLLPKFIPYRKIFSFQIVNHIKLALWVYIIDLFLWVYFFSVNLFGYHPSFDSNFNYFQLMMQCSGQLDQLIGVFQKHDITLRVKKFHLWSQSVVLGNVGQSHSTSSSPLLLRWKFGQIRP